MRTILTGENVGGASIFSNHRTDNNAMTQIAKIRGEGLLFSHVFVRDNEVLEGYISAMREVINYRQDF